MSTKILAAVWKTVSIPAAYAPVPDTEVVRLLNARGTVRNFKPDPIPEAWVNAMIAASQRAPTSSNIQAYSIIVVRDAAIKAKLAELAGNQQHIIDCPVYFALCADLTRLRYACELHGQQYPGKTFEAGLVASLDAALVGMTMSMVADSFGLGSVMIGGMRTKPLEVAKALKLPPRVYVVFGLCVGWPKTAPLPKPRQPMSAVVQYDTYDNTKLGAGIAEYDLDLARYYGRRGIKTTEQAWTQPIAEKFSTDRRKRLRQELNELGFELE